jgi:hypothetical protein
VNAPSPRLILRLAILALCTVVIQETAVSQISIFGISADLTPLVVMSVGLLSGSLPGAVMGFATGLLVDTVLVQTLGVTSLLGVESPVSWLLLQQIFITVLVNTLISLPVYALVSRLITPALPDDPRRRRRRAYTTGGLSPLQSPSQRLGPMNRPARGGGTRS